MERFAKLRLSLMQIKESIMERLLTAKMSTASTSKISLESVWLVISLQVCTSTSQVVNCCPNSQRTKVTILRQELFETALKKAVLIANRTSSCADSVQSDTYCVKVIVCLAQQQTVLTAMTTTKCVYGATGQDSIG